MFKSLIFPLTNTEIKSVGVMINIKCINIHLCFKLHTKILLINSVKFSTLFLKRLQGMEKGEGEIKSAQRLKNLEKRKFSISSTYNKG